MIPRTAKRREAALSVRAHSHSVKDLRLRRTFTHRGAEPA
jgi:hypothetical protein